MCTKQSFILIQEPTVDFQHLSSVCAHDSISAPQLHNTRQVSFVIAFVFSNLIHHVNRESKKNQFHTASSCSLSELPLFDYSNQLDSCRGVCPRALLGNCGADKAEETIRGDPCMHFTLHLCSSEQHVGCIRGKRALRRPPFHLLNHVFFFH